MLTFETLYGVVIGALLTVLVITVFYLVLENKQQAEKTTEQKAYYKRKYISLKLDNDTAYDAAQASLEREDDHLD